jgi:hypothetical protein
MKKDWTSYFPELECSSREGGGAGNARNEKILLQNYSAILLSELPRCNVVKEDAVKEDAVKEDAVKEKRADR